MEILDIRRLKLLGLFWSRIKIFFYFVKKRKFKNAYVYLWVSLFTRDAGLAIIDWLYRIKPDFAPYPKAIEVEVTTRCHLRCIICEHTYWDEPAKDMSFDEFKRIVDQFPKLKWIGLSGIGSSFLNKDFLKMLQYLKSKNVFIEFFDTFDLINREISQELVRIGIDKIWMSIDAATKETYEKIRVGTNFDKVIGNLKTLIEVKKQYKTPIPEIWFHYIINKYNVLEMPKFVDLVQLLIGESKTNYATLIFFTSLLYFAEIEDLRSMIPEEIKNLVLEKTKNYNLYLNWNENVVSSKPITDCTKWTEPFVLVTGHIQPCCAINEANDREFQKANSFANLLVEDFRDIWYSERLKKFKKNIHRRIRPRICKNCRIYKI
jgi:MoaA/NifB/PqqE/SkfB family radical SAM enzyme